MRARRPVTHVATLLAAASLIAMIQSASAQTSFEGEFLIFGRSGQRLTPFVEEARRVFWTSDINTDGIVSVDDYEQASLQASSAMRADAVAEFLRFDTNGDGVATRDEILRAELQKARSDDRPRPERFRLSEEVLRRYVDGLVDLRMRADTNRDGRVEFAEMLAAARSRPAPSAEPTQSRLSLLSAADENNDGVTDIAEFDRAAERAFRTIDTDGDQSLSADEAETFRARIRGRTVAPSAANRPGPSIAAERPAAETASRPGCAMPRASDAAQVILLSAYEPESVSTTTIASQDIEIGTASITIEPGSGPIYIVAATYEPTIWRISGSVERLERLVLTSTTTAPGARGPERRPLAGATGVPAERVTFLGQTACIRYFAEAPSIASATATGTIAREAGKAPAVVSARYQVSGFAVPSGGVRAASTTGPRRQIAVQTGEGPTVVVDGKDSTVITQTSTASLESQLQRTKPGGVVEIDPKDVVASHVAERYEVLPQEAGLIQLVRSGALKQNIGREFLITKKIRMPAGLSGGHLAKFVLLRGVPEPDGDFGHSTVISEETGMPIVRQAQRPNR
jgi:Ca2+-binding EF-hand superfamily protein